MWKLTQKDSLRIPKSWTSAHQGVDGFAIYYKWSVSYLRASLPPSRIAYLGLGVAGRALAAAGLASAVGAGAGGVGAGHFESLRGRVLCSVW